MFKDSLLYFSLLLVTVVVRQGLAVEIKKPPLREQFAKSIQKRVADNRGKAKMNKQERLHESVKAIYRQVAAEKEQYAYFCSESEYFDRTSETCEKCATLCEMASPKMCQIYCPWIYAKNLVQPQIDDLEFKTDVLIGSTALCFFGLFVLILIFTFKWKMKRRPKSRLPSYTSAKKLESLKRNDSSLFFSECNPNNENQEEDPTANQREPSDSESREHNSTSGSDADDESRPITFNAIPPTTGDY